jgi:uncharacterized protein YndB with AHSA1/START domain
MPKTEKKQKAIRQSVRVDCPIDDAFRLFTEAFGDWWPLRLYSVTEEDAETCIIEPWEGGRIFERTRSGEEVDWGTVTSCNPPRHLRFVWDPARAGRGSQTVEVDFSVVADGTQVTLTHSGWEAPGVSVCSAQPASNLESLPALLAQFFSEFVTRQMAVMV